MKNQKSGNKAALYNKEDAAKMFAQLKSFKPSSPNTKESCALFIGQRSNSVYIEAANESCHVNCVADVRCKSITI